MVLVDTSVWVRSFRRRAYPTEAAALAALLDDEQVAGHRLVYGELLVGDRGGRVEVLRLYARFALHLAAIEHEEVVAFVRQHRLMGRGLGWTDCQILAAAVVASVPVWTVDAALAQACTMFGLAWRP